ncbi:hypothetical protein AABB24_019402 [Solanum stoloniferum]|uniref:Uncharacterized protein n=2 Tax=Solanum TaxID=4107 RepID=A0AAF0UXS9_SOLVR|nr:uncharacterized protein LOC125837274 [Solanum verrucosum]WMV53263.1 hypothetical protein MTR67_046648 [Solanum verrucosum]
METYILIQLAILLFTLGIFCTIYNFPKQALTRLRSKTRSTNQANSHFIKGAKFLSRAKSNRSKKSTSFNLAKLAAGEADKALSIDPKDPAAHILKALSLDLIGHKLAALRSLDSALSPPAVKSLSEGERADALLKRAELLVALNRKRRVDSALMDLFEALKLDCSDRAKAFCLLGQCYEIKGLKIEAHNAFEEALKVEPNLVLAHGRLGRLR